MRDRWEGGSAGLRGPPELAILVLLLVLLLPQYSSAEEGCATEVEGGGLRAFEPPPREAVEQAVRQVCAIGAIVLGGIVLFFFGWWYFYEPESRMIGGKTTAKEPSGSVSDKAPPKKARREFLQGED